MRVVRTADDDITDLYFIAVNSLIIKQTDTRVSLLISRGKTVPQHQAGIADNQTQKIMIDRFAEFSFILPEMFIGNNQIL
ncbi:hypothetical protein SDC9_206321 [bioreactor metagenome]|uniref:Uncharacterized protein n=1 Tax=bioreactor metagenome TaxID=1076179 RepID=A0A645JDX5_9ZZZZ